MNQLPVTPGATFLPGVVTVPLRNETDGSFTFNYVIKVYKENEPRNFNDARGMVISDYQQVLEDKWVTQLKKKYPVKVNSAVFSAIKLFSRFWAFYTNSFTPFQIALGLPNV